MYLTTTLPQKTPTGMFLWLPNVHIFHIFTFTVYDILVGMWDLTYVGLTRLSSGSVPCLPGVSVSLPPSDRFVLSLFSHCREKMEQSKSLGCSYVSVLRGTLFPLRLRCTHQSEPDTVEQLKVSVESTESEIVAPSVIRTLSHLRVQNAVVCFLYRFYTVCYNSCEVPLFLRWWV